MHEQTLFSINEAARILGIGRSTLYVIIKDGRLPVRKLGKRTLIHRADIDLLVDTLPRGGGVQ